MEGKVQFSLEAPLPVCGNGVKKGWATSCLFITEKQSKNQRAVEGLRKKTCQKLQLNSLQTFLFQKTFNRIEQPFQKSF